MKLLIISALIAVSAAARLEHLEQAARGGFEGATSNKYLPPFGSNSASQGPNGFGSSNGFGSNNGFGSSNGLGATSGGAASRFGDATSNKYLPPFGGNSNSLGGNGINNYGSAAQGAGSPFDAATSNKYLPPNQTPGFGAAGSRPQPNSQYGAPQQGFGHSGPSSFGQPGFGSQPSLGSQPSFSQTGFGSQPGFGQSAYGQTGNNGQFGQPGFGSFGQSRPQGSQYRPGSQNIPQQSFDEETGYHY